MPLDRSPIRMLFPGGLAHAVCLSFDDGQEHDRRLAALLDRHDVPATFHLVSGNFGRSDPRFRFVQAGEVAGVYARHEVACHGRWHAGAPASHAASWIIDLLDDRRALEAASGRLVRGAAWPGGDGVVGLDAQMEGIGIAWCRTTGSGNRAAPEPGAWHRWCPTCTWSDADGLLPGFLASKQGGVFMAWGHSYDLDAEDGWTRMERLAAAWAAARAWRTTLGGLHDYVTAWRGLRCSADGAQVHNPWAQPLWLRNWGEVLLVPPGATIVLAPVPG
jgi:peptidoglycan/xylan/chitin deacetylase (PgdA/CDA1 family)